MAGGTHASALRWPARPSWPPLPSWPPGGRSGQGDPARGGRSVRVTQPPDVAQEASGSVVAASLARMPMRGRDGSRGARLTSTGHTGVAEAEGRTPAGLSPLRVAVAGSAAGKVVEMATLAVLAIVVPRVLGPFDYGRFAVPLTIVTVGSLALTLGGPAVMARFVPLAPPTQRVALARALGVRLARGRAVQLAVMGTVTAVAVAVRPDLLDPFDTSVVAVALALNVAASLLLQVGLGLGRTLPWSARYPLQNAVLVVAVLCLYPIAGTTGTTLALVVAGVAAMTFAAVTVAPAVGGAHPPVPIPTGALRFGSVQAAAAALAQATQRGGVLAVALLAGSAAQTGFASLAVGIALGATYAVLQTFTVCLPHLAGASPAPREPVPARDPGDPRPGREPSSPSTSVEGGSEAAEVVLRRLAGGLLAVIVPLALVAALALDGLVPAVFGDDFRGAAGAFGPALAMVVLAPLHSLVVQASALRLRPEAALAGGVAAALAFTVTAVVAVPAWGATGGTAAGLAAGAAGVAVALALLPGAAGRVLPMASASGAVAVLAVAAVTT